MARLILMIPFLLCACQATDTAPPSDELRTLREENALLREDMATLRGEVEQLRGEQSPTDAEAELEDKVAPEAVTVLPASTAPEVTHVTVARSVALRTVARTAESVTLATATSRFATDGFLPAKAWLRLEVTHGNGAGVDDVRMKFLARHTKGRYAARKRMALDVDGKKIQCEVIDHEAKRVRASAGRRKGYTTHETVTVRVPIDLVRQIARAKRVTFEDFTLSVEQLGFFAAVSGYASTLEGADPRP